MNASNLLEQHPKVAAIIKAYYLDKLLNSLNTDAIPDDYKEFVIARGVPIESLLAIIDNVPRDLFDVLDSQKVYIETSVDTDGVFWWKIGDTQSVIGWEKRKDAEREAIEEAFKILEEKL